MDKEFIDRRIATIETIRKHMIAGKPTDDEIVRMSALKRKHSYVGWE